MQEQFLKLCEEFLEYLWEIRGYSETSIVTYEIALKQMLDDSYLETEDGIVTLNITPFRHKILKNSKKTISKKLSAARSFVKYLNEQKNMHVIIYPNESIKVPKTLPKPIEQNYIEEVLESANLEQKTIITMLYGLGLRISELSQMRLEDIKDEWVQVHGKGNKTRELPLIPRVRSIINTYLDTYAPKKYLFEKNSAPLNSAQIRYKITNIFKSHGIKTTPHQLRHSFATHLLNNGARIADVSELLGHATMATTQIYTKLAESKKLEEYLKAHPLNQKS
ncbi:MAG: tyrosine-type recombinase/integrase [Campylobacterales bacterium]|nr:tyrosine-type recombinase/integrase [Campylobacterales bacterium]